VGDVLAAVVVAPLQAARHVLGEAAEALAHALADRLQRLEPGGALGGVDADGSGEWIGEGPKGPLGPRDQIMSIRFIDAGDEAEATGP
jgi:hypothetical protein